MAFLSFRACLIKSVPVHLITKTKRIYDCHIIYSGFSKIDASLLAIIWEPVGKLVLRWLFSFFPMLHSITARNSPQERDYKQTHTGLKPQEILTGSLVLVLKH